MHKTLKIILAVAAVIIVGVWLFGSKRNTEPANQPSASPTEEEMIDVAEQSFHEKYTFTRPDLSGLDYTYQLEDELVKKGQAVGLVGSIDDVYYKDNALRFRLSRSYLDFSTPDIYYDLGGCSEQIKDLTTDRKISYSADVYVVASISRVEKAALALSGIAYDQDDVELNWESASAYTATGECLDLSLIGSGEFR